LNPLLRFIQILSGLLAACYRSFKASKDDIQYFYNPTLFDSSLALCISRFRGLVTVVDQTEIYSINQYKTINKISEFLSAKYASLILTISKPIHDHFSSRREEGVVPSTIFVDFDRFRISVESENFLIGYIGSFADKDGVPMIIKGFAGCLKRFPLARLRLIGNDPFPDKTTKLIHELGLTDFVEVVGKVNYNEIPKLLNECDTLVMNRTSSEFAETGYPIKLGEYLACNRTVVMSDGPGFSEDYTHLSEVIKYQVDSTSDFTKKLIWRYENVEKASEIARIGNEYAKRRFDASKEVKVISDNLKSIWNRK
ncbi:MAG: glycosyltransferase family 4 protein, partial [Bacteroidia bacterium]